MKLKTRFGWMWTIVMLGSIIAFSINYFLGILIVLLFILSALMKVELILEERKTEKIK